MRRLASITLGVVMAVPAMSGAANADTPGCVSKREFNRIAVGMGQPRVHRIFDTVGNRTGLGGPNVVYHYRPCGSAGGIVQVSYNSNLRVVGKSGNWFS